MNAESLMRFVIDYGSIIIFIFVLLEYMNLPGLPAGVIMPVVGILAARGNINFAWAILITIIAGLLGSIVLYLLGRASGGFLLEKYYHFFPKQRNLIEEKMNYLRKKGCVGIFICKLIPMVRTLIGIPAGAIRMNFWEYCISSVLGIALWNVTLVGAGYVFGDAALQVLA